MDFFLLCYVLQFLVSNTLNPDPHCFKMLDPDLHLKF
jgi:hypothetical protein